MTAAPRGCRGWRRQIGQTSDVEQRGRRAGRTGRTPDGRRMSVPRCGEHVPPGAHQPAQHEMHAPRRGHHRNQIIQSSAAAAGSVSNAAPATSTLSRPSAEATSVSRRPPIITPGTRLRSHYGLGEEPDHRRPASWEAKFMLAIPEQSRLACRISATNGRKIAFAKVIPMHVAFVQRHVRGERRRGCGAAAWRGARARPLSDNVRFLRHRDRRTSSSSSRL